MGDETNTDDVPGQESDDGRHDRRRALKIGAAVTGAAWIAPAILSLDAAAAQTAAPADAFVSGRLLCQHNQQPFGIGTITFSGPGGVFQTQSIGTYTLGPMPPGAYTVSTPGMASFPINLPAGNTTGIDLFRNCL